MATDEERRALQLRGSTRSIKCGDCGLEMRAFTDEEQCRHTDRCGVTVADEDKKTMEFKSQFGFLPDITVHNETSSALDITTTAVAGKMVFTVRAGKPRPDARALGRAVDACREVAGDDEHAAERLDKDGDEETAANCRERARDLRAVAEWLDAL